MKRTNWLLLFILLIANCGLSAQSKRFSFTVSPVLLSFVTTTVQAGPGYRFGNDWGIQTDFCYASPSHKQTAFNKTTLFRAAVELKKYLRTGSTHPYLSFQSAYHYRKMIATDSGGFYNKAGPEYYARYRTAVIHSPILNFAVKCGIEVDVVDWLFLDFFFGMGARTVFTHYDAQDVRAAQNFYFSHNGISPNAAYRYNYTLTRFHMPFGVRMGIRL